MSINETSTNIARPRLLHLFQRLRDYSHNKGRIRLFIKYMTNATNSLEYHGIQKRIEIVYEIFRYIDIYKYVWITNGKFIKDIREKMISFRSQGHMDLNIKYGDSFGFEPMCKYRVKKVDESINRPFCKLKSDKNHVCWLHRKKEDQYKNIISKVLVMDLSIITLDYVGIDI